VTEGFRCQVSGVRRWGVEDEKIRRSEGKRVRGLEGRKRVIVMEKVKGKRLKEKGS